jgi:hypothetical protein
MIYDNRQPTWEDVEDLQRQIDGLQRALDSLRGVNTERCVDGGLHEYPQAWNGLFPPPCRKCGEASGIHAGVTCRG